MTQDINILKQNAIKVAEKHGFTDALFNEEFKKQMDHFKEIGVPDENLEMRALKKMIVGFKKRSLNNEKIFNAVIFKRTASIDLSQKQRNTAIEYADTHGMDKAIIDRYMNEKGEPLYKGDKKNPDGKVIPKNTAFASMSGLLQEPDSDEGRIIDIYLNGEDIDVEIPMFKKIQLSVRMNPNNPNIGNFKNFEGIIDDDMNTHEFCKMLKNHYEHKCENNFNKFGIIGDKLQGGDFIVSEGYVFGEGAIEDDKDFVMVTLAPLSSVEDLDSDEDELVITLFADKKIFNGIPSLDEERVLFLASPYEKYNEYQDKDVLTGNIFGIIPFEGEDNE